MVNGGDLIPYAASLVSAHTMRASHSRRQKVLGSILGGGSNTGAIASLISPTRKRMYWQQQIFTGMGVSDSLSKRGMQ